MTENYDDIYKIGKDLDNYIDNMHLYFGKEKLKSIIKGGDNSYISLDEKMRNFKGEKLNYNNNSKSENKEGEARKIIKNFVKSKSDDFSDIKQLDTLITLSHFHKEVLKKYKEHQNSKEQSKLHLNNNNNDSSDDG